MYIRTNAVCFEHLNLVVIGVNYCVVWTRVTHMQGERYKHDKTSSTKVLLLHFPSASPNLLTVPFIPYKWD